MAGTDNKPAVERKIPTVFHDVNDLKVVLFANYQKQIENFFGDPDRAREFLSNVMAAVQRLPKLLECTPITVINSFMVMASLKLMPSGVSGEAYVLPYKNKGVMEAQFQLGYQGLVTLFYRAGVRSIAAEIIRKNDKYSYINGVLTHEVDVFSDDRGEALGAYVRVETQQGGIITKVMSKKEILGIAQKFSKSYGGDFSPWNEKSDPELWMWKKTVLKQAAKLVPKNETIFKAIDADNQDSIIADRLDAAKEASKSLSMGNLVKHEKIAEESTDEAGENQAAAADRHEDENSIDRG
jgi:phage RecT family recombinase